MAENKIRISWDDIARPDVDEKVKQQELLARAQEHYGREGQGREGQGREGGQQFAPAGSNPYAAPQSTPAAGFSLASIWYNTLVYMTAFGFVGGVLGWAILETAWQLTSQAHDEESAGDVIILLVGMALVGGALSVSLSIADHVVAQNWRSALINGCVGLALGMLGGVINLFVGCITYNSLGGGDISTPFAMQVFARTLAWAMIGLFLAVAPGIVLMNLKRCAIGMTGGFIGGILGGMTFDVIAEASNDTLSRLVGVVTIGLVSGLGTGVIELAAKTGWLKVAAGLIAGKQFVLYKNPTYIGSSPQCEIYLFKDPQVSPQHAALHQVAGGYDLEDLRSSSGTLVGGRKVSRVRLRNNDQIQIGSTTLLFQEKQRS